MTVTASPYKYGFLEQAVTTGQCFLNSPENNPIAVLKLAGPAERIGNAAVSYIQVQPTSSGPKFKCEIIANGVRLVSHDDFVLSGNEYIDTLPSSAFVHGFVKAGECFLTYSVRLESDYETPPVEAASSDGIYYLSPLSLEPYVGDVQLTVKTGQETNMLNYDVETVSDRLVSFTEGLNYELTTTTNGEMPNFVFNSVAGGGLGKQPCPPPTAPLVASNVSAPYVASVNGLTPNSKGELTLSTNANACVSVNSLQRENKIQLDAHCAPCCRCSDYADVQKYIRSYAMIYVNLVQEFNRLVNIYNTINQAFQNQLACCDSFDKINPRIRVWPQQNFKVQVQALAENNKKRRVCLCDVDLDLTVTNKNNIAATEVIENLDGSTTSIEHILPAGQPLIITPLKEGAYVYFKSQNPNNGVALDTSAGTGRLKVTSNIQSLPFIQPCEEEGPTPTNCMDPCSGYFMVTSGFSIVDPTFRKIANIKNEDTEISVKVVFKYNGTADNPCANCSWQPIYDKVKTVKITPNRKSTNPCAPVKLKDITSVTPADPTLPIEYFANFPEAVTVKHPGSALVVTRKVYNGVTQTYDLVGDPISVPIDPGSYTSIEVPNPFGGQIPSSSLGLIMTVSSNGANMVTLCQPNPNSSATVEIPVSPSSVGVSFTL